MNIYYQKKIGIDIKYYFKEIFKVIKGMLPSMILAYIFFKIEISSIFYFIILIIIFVIFYGVSLWIFSMNDFEKNLFLKPIKKIRKGSN